jgi:surface protein
MKTIITNLLLSTLCLIGFSLFTISCMDEDLPVKSIIKKEKINGYIQKGPFVSGTTILMNELNADLSQTGKIFTSQITNDQGLFEINNVELSSSFVEFIATGFYFNEIDGGISVSPITLSTLSDVTNKNTINVNVLTHLEKKRVENLIKGGKSFSEAKTQARNEVLTLFAASINNNAEFEDFDITQNNEQGGILLAASIILQGNRSVGQLTELLSKIQNDIATEGVLKDENLINTLRATAFTLDMADIRANISNRYKELNISTAIPDFEKHITRFFDLKDLRISIEGQGSVKQVVIDKPNNAGREYPNGTWIELTPEAATGWAFDSWGGDLSGNEIPQTILVDEEKHVTVTFKRINYPLNITIAGEGTVTLKILSDLPEAGNESENIYPYETVIELTPVPDEGSVFENWGGDLQGVEIPQVITMTGEKNITLTFRKPIFRLADNGVTCICENVKPGEKGLINGIEYEVVDNQLIRQRRDQGADMTKLCTSLVTNMGSLFYDKSFNQAIGNWDVSKVTNMERMFHNSPFNQDIGKWDVGNVTNMAFMFHQAGFNKAIGNWNVSNVTTMLLMFQGSPFNQPIGNWDVGKVRSMHRMFEATPFNQPINNWDVSNVTDMGQMFRLSGFNQPIGSWNVSNVKDMRDMFRESPFNQAIGNWNVGNVISMETMFLASSFNQAIGNWDVSNVTTMLLMFGGSPFNQPIGNWDVSKVRNMHRMFESTPFNQPINNWDVSNVTDMRDMFGFTPFNQPIGNWNVSNVTDMSHMFRHTPFNQPIGTWNVKNVRSMEAMFAQSQFNQNISKWCVENFSSEPANFSIGSPLSDENKPVWGTCPDN